MKFNERVTQLTDKPPDGWLSVMSPTEYVKLDNERKNYYSPVYGKYRTKKYRAYDECDNFIGWEPMQVGIGEPVSYRYHGKIMAKVVDSVLHSNILMTRMMK